MEKEKLIIYDDSCFKEVTIQDLKGERIGILFETFQNISDNSNKNMYNVTRDDMLMLIKLKKLVINNVPTLYSDVSEHDKIICFALVKSSEYDVTVCTRNEELALDLLLNGIKVKTDDYGNNFTNTGKSSEKNDIFIYDTCALLFYMEKIDFSKNTHYIPVCVLEEIIKKSNVPKNPVITGSLFKCLYVYNKYPEHVKILNTVSSTQRGGRYSYTDLLILYSTIRSKNVFKDSHITLVTKDRQLFFESMYLNLFNVTDKFDYFDGKSHVEEDVSGNIEDDKNNDVLNSDEETAEAVETDICNEEEDIPNDSSECNYGDATDENIVIDDSENILAHEEDNLEYEHYEDDENVTTSLSKLLENTDLYNTVDEALESEDSESSIMDAVSDVEDELSISDTSFELEQEKNERPMSLEEKVVKVTNNYKKLPLKKLHRKNVVNLPDIIEHVYSSKFRLMTPVVRRKIEKGFTPETFIIKVGYYITFKNKPNVSYRVVSIDNLTATLVKI